MSTATLLETLPRELWARDRVKIEAFLDSFTDAEEVLAYCRRNHLKGRRSADTPSTCLITRMLDRAMEPMGRRFRCNSISIWIPLVGISRWSHPTPQAFRDVMVSFDNGQLSAFTEP